VSIEDLLRALAEAPDGAPEATGRELRAEFLRACRRLDDNPAEQQRISDIADLLDADEALYAGARAALDVGDQYTALPLLRQCAEAGTGEAPWLLAQLLEAIGHAGEAIIWYQRAADDGDSRAAGRLASLHARQRPLPGGATREPVADAGSGRRPEAVNAASRQQQRAAPAMIRARDISRAADGAASSSRWLADPGCDLRVMNPGVREEATGMIVRLDELLRRCPPGAFGGQASAVVLAEVATLSDALIADRDEHAALRLIRAASPHLAFLGRRHPAAFAVRRARAEALCELGHCRHAEILLRQLGKDEERVYGSDDPRTALLLLWVLTSSGQLREAEAGFRALGARLARPQGASSLMLWHLQCRYSWLLAQQGLVGDSASGYDGVVISRSRELGAGHPDVLDARHSKGKVLVVAGRGSQAVTLLRAVADDRARVQGDHHPDTLETLKYLHLARVQAEPRDDRVLGHAIGALERILRIQDSRHGPGYPMSGDTAAQLGRLLRLRDTIRWREPAPALRQVPVPGEGQGRAVPLPGQGNAPWHAHQAPGEIARPE
jgi:hypothetical protein